MQVTCRRPSAAPLIRRAQPAAVLTCQVPRMLSHLELRCRSASIAPHSRRFGLHCCPLQQSSPTNCQLMDSLYVCLHLPTIDTQGLGARCSRSCRPWRQGTRVEQQREGRQPAAGRWAWRRLAAVLCGATPHRSCLLLLKKRTLCDPVLLHVGQAAIVASA